MDKEFQINGCVLPDVLNTNNEEYFVALSDDADVYIPIFKVFFDGLIRRKLSFYLIFTFFAVYKKAVTNVFRVTAGNIRNYFHIAMNSEYFESCMKEINSNSDILGFAISYDKNFRYEITDMSAVTGLSKSASRVYLENVKNYYPLSVNALKLALYIDAFDCLENEDLCVPVDTDKLRKIFGVENTELYSSYSVFNRKILTPSVNAINKLGCYHLIVKANKRYHKPINEVYLKKEKINE